MHGSVGVFLVYTFSQMTRFTHFFVALQQQQQRQQQRQQPITCYFQKLNCI